MKSVPLERRGDYIVKMYELEDDVCRQMLARCTAVAFEADQIDPIAESGWSVLVRGTATHVRDPDRIAALADTAVHPWAPVGVTAGSRSMQNRSPGGSSGVIDS